MNNSTNNNNVATQKKNENHSNSHTIENNTQKTEKTKDLYNEWMEMRANKYFRQWIFLFLYFCGLFSLRFRAKMKKTKTIRESEKKRRFLKTLIFIELSIEDARFAYGIFLTHYA